MGETLPVQRTTRGAQKRRLLFWEVNERGRPVVVSISPEGMDDAEYLAAVHKMADELTDEAICYFVGGEDGPVKIGYAKDPKRRLVDLQNGSPVRLSILAQTSGGLTRETAYHYQFAKFRLHGEWFERCPDIEAEIARLNGDAPNHDGAS
jgi:hypothetical protein